MEGLPIRWIIRIGSPIILCEIAEKFTSFLLITCKYVTNRMNLVIIGLIESYRRREK